MHGIGHRPARLLPPSAIWAVLGALAALLPALWMWGFTVDDALIAIRYARHLAQGGGWRFNTGAPSTDGVTPLPWPLVLAPVARADALVVLWRAKALGLLAWVVAGAALGAAIGRVEQASRWSRGASLATMALSVPLAAHAVSGMETALATALATFAAIHVRRPLLASTLAGLAAALRPEMAPWACVLAAGSAAVAVAQSRSPAALPDAWRAIVGRASVFGLLSLVPFALCAAVRAVVWGRAAPLALWAKPSDVNHGLAYAAAACVVTLVPILALAPRALARSAVALALVLAAVVHVAAIVVVGGDWMPYARLMVPVGPALVYASVLASQNAHRLAVTARAVVALGLGALLIGRGGTAGRGVGAQRAALVVAAGPALAGVRRVAALDVGWVGAATDADVVDLAGLTDPRIATLRGGHTSKRVDAIFLLSLGPDALLLYAPTGLPGHDLARWYEAEYPRVVEARLALDPVIGRHFGPAAWLPLGTGGGGYVLLKARPEDS
jgi:hypothetical protein